MLHMMAKAIVDQLSEKTLERLGTTLAKQVMKDTLLFLHGKIDLDSWIKVTRERSMRSNFNYKEVRDDKSIKIVINHGMGKKWSFFHKVYYSQMLHDLGKSAKIEFTDNTLVLEIKL